MPEFDPLILIADDEPDTVELVRLYLANENYRFITAADGGETVRLARQQHPDLILLDINMPVLSGFEVLEQLRRDPATATIVAIVMTAAYGRREHRLQGFALGADDYILKPLDRRELAARIRSRLRVKRLEHDLREQSQELESLYRVAQEIATTLNPPELANKLLKAAGKLLDAEDGWIILINESGSALHAERYGEMLAADVARRLARQSLQDGIGAEVSRTETGLLIPDSSVDERYATGEFGLARIRSIVSVPLLGRRHNRGVLCYVHTMAGRFTMKHFQWLRTVAGQAAVALDNAYLFTREQRRAVQSRLLNSVTQDMTSVLELDQLLDVVVNLIQRTFGFYYVGLATRQDDHLVIQAVAREQGKSGAELLGSAETEGATLWAVQHGRPLLINDTRRDPRHEPKVSLGETLSELALPIRADGEIIGVLDIRSPEVNAFDPDDVIMLEMFSAQVSIAIQNARLFRALSSQREQLNAILNSVTSCVLVTDQNNTLLLVNPAARRLLGVEAAPEKGPVEPDELPGDLWPFLTEPIPAGETLAGSYQTPDGLSFQVIAAPVMVGEERAGRVLLLNDVTAFAELSRLKDEFVATVSHDLKDPLTVVLGAAYWLAQPETEDPKRIELVERIQDSAGRMQTLITQLLDLGKLNSGMGLEQTAMDAHPLLLEAIEDYQEQIETAGLSLTLEAAAPLWIDADRDRLRQVLDNLISNAMRYTPVGGSIALMAAGQDDEVLFQVRDTGVGILPKDQPYVFDKFYRGEMADSQHAEGTGLGLAIVRSIVEAHGGRVWLESAPGVGTTFSFTLPAASPEGQPAESSPD